MEVHEDVGSTDGIGRTLDMPNKKLTCLILEWYQKGFWRVCGISFMSCAKFLKEAMETHKVLLHDYVYQQLCASSCA